MPVRFNLRYLQRKAMELSGRARRVEKEARAVSQSDILQAVIYNERASKAWLRYTSKVKEQMHE